MSRNNRRWFGWPFAKWFPTVNSTFNKWLRFEVKSRSRFYVFFNEILLVLLRCKKYVVCIVSASEFCWLVWLSIIFQTCAWVCVGGLASKYIARCRLWGACHRYNWGLCINSDWSCDCSIIVGHKVTDTKKQRGKFYGLAQRWKSFWLDVA